MLLLEDAILGASRSRGSGGNVHGRDVILADDSVMTGLCEHLCARGGGDSGSSGSTSRSRSGCTSVGGDRMLSVFVVLARLRLRLDVLDVLVGRSVGGRCRCRRGVGGSGLNLVMFRMFGGVFLLLSEELLGVVGGFLVLASSLLCSLLRLLGGFLLSSLSFVSSLLRGLLLLQLFTSAGSGLGGVGVGSSHGAGGSGSGGGRGGSGSGGGNGAEILENLLDLAFGEIIEELKVTSVDLGEELTSFEFV